MIAADDRLFVVSEEGALFCFGADETQVARHTVGGTIDRPQDAWAQRAAAMLEQTDRGGFALVLGAGSGRLVHELLGQSEMHVIVVEPDAARALQMRRLFDEAGYYGRRVAVLQADPAQVELPPYFAGLVTAEELSALGTEADAVERMAGRLFGFLRPYGGAAWLPLPDEGHQAIGRWAGVRGIWRQRDPADRFTTIVREDRCRARAVDASIADSANSGVSGQPCAHTDGAAVVWRQLQHHNALPRHQNGPVPHVVGGRLIILGVDTISAGTCIPAASCGNLSAGCRPCVHEPRA